ncbi:MAG: tail fiber protein [Verrucomicrobia bacterium]|nr:tail fiber protein [Verrucomicrobiota bacterium]
MTPYVGEVRLVAWPRIPVDWQPCDGRALPISQYEMLYSLIGTTYGGDGVNTFNVPDLRGRIPLHNGPVNPLGQAVGTETVTLLTTQLPAHNHLAAGNAAAGTADTPLNNFPAVSATISPYSTDVTSPAQFNPLAITLSGGSLPHDNMMPTLTASFIIATAGIYPSSS